MSGDISAAAAFLISSTVTENMFNHIENHKLAGENDSLRKKLESSKHTTLKGASGTNEYAKVLYDKNEQIAELNKQLKSNPIVDELKLQVVEMKELSQAWEERALVQEAQKDSWKRRGKDFIGKWRSNRYQRRSSTKI